MLKLRINKNNISDDKDKIITLYYRELDIDINSSEREKSKSSIVVTTNNLEKIKENTQIICYHNVSYQNENGEENIVPYIRKYNVTTINPLFNTFSFLYGKYESLSIERVYVDKNEENEEIVYFVFENPHFFRVEDTDIIIYFAVNNEFFEVGDVNFVTNRILGISKNIITENITLNDYIFTENNNIDTTFISVYRESYFFSENDRIELYYNNPKCSIMLPLTKNYDVNLLKESWITDYVNTSKEKCINPIVDMEKDIYYPVFPSDDENYEYVDKIIFNLHFREHSGENWLVEPESMWNGVNQENGKLNNEFFNFSDNDKRSRQSDLLTYLNFTDSDVRFQKNKLKKSFLRLLFYDSDNPANQNLLMYSTIFMNSGEYFNKFIRYIEEYPYRMLTTTEEGILDTRTNLKGIKVNREPGNNGNNTEPFEEIEDKRLSSRFVVEDKYNSRGSCEGFYVYLWKNILDGLTTEEEKKKGLTLYMKVEFNHAGYGRIVPFMMPYWDKKKWENEKEGIKTFEEIVTDWYDDSNTTDGKYGARQYSKFSYIKLNIKYDESKGNYIYCLSDEYYGKASTQKKDDNTLIINLYEANMV